MVGIRGLDRGGLGTRVLGTWDGRSGQDSQVPLTFAPSTSTVLGLNVRQFYENSEDLG